MSAAILASFVPVLLALGTWLQPFLRRNGPKSRNAAGGQRPRRRPRRSHARGSVLSLSLRDINRTIKLESIHSSFFVSQEDVDSIY